MKFNPEQDEKNVLAHWTYTRQEWKAFLRWKKLQRSVLHYIFHRLVPAGRLRIPEIRITHDQVITDLSQESFIDLERELRRVAIKDAGSMNIIEIIYERKGEKGRSLDEIRLPIPKGKLREAINLQQKLTIH